MRRVFGIPKTNLVGFNKLQAQIVIIDPKPHQNTFFFNNAIENSSMDLSRKSQTSTNTSEFDPVEVRNLNRSRHESMSKVQGRESLIFQIYAAFSVDFPNTYDDCARQCYWFISFVILHVLVNESDFCRPAPTRFSPLLFMFCTVCHVSRKKKNFRIRSKEKLKKILSLRVRLMIAQFKCSNPLFTVKERFSSRLVVLL